MKKEKEIETPATSATIAYANREWSTPQLSDLLSKARSIALGLERQSGQIKGAGVLEKYTNPRAAWSEKEKSAVDSCRLFEAALEKIAQFGKLMGKS